MPINKLYSTNRDVVNCIVDFKLHSVMLACRCLHGSHTDEHIYRHFQELVAYFRMSSKVKLVVTDNVSNVKRAYKLFGDLTADIQ